MLIFDVKDRMFGKKETKGEALRAYRNAYESGSCMRIKG